MEKVHEASTLHNKPKQLRNPKSGEKPSPGKGTPTGNPVANSPESACTPVCEYIILYVVSGHSITAP